MAAAPGRTRAPAARTGSGCASARWSPASWSSPGRSRPAPPGASGRTSPGKIRVRPSPEEPVHRRQPDTHQAADDGAVQPDELEVAADPRLDHRHQRAGIEGLQVLTHREPDLVMVAAEQVVGRRTDPAVEGRTTLGIVEELADPRSQRAIDERGERAVRVVQLLFQLAAQARERVPHEGSRLEALDQGAAQPLGLGERCEIAGGEAIGPAPEAVEDGAPEGMRRIAGRATQLGRCVVARRLDDLALHYLAPQHERQEALAALL